MHHVQDKLSTQLSTSHGLWSWALRHASWLLNRFAVVHGSTPFELVYNKVYKGRMTEFGEPAFAYTHTAFKGNPRWQRVIVLGKTESQDTYIVYTGSTIMLTRSVRRIATDWKCHMGFFLHFNSPTWRFKTGFGGRVIPTKRSIQGQAASFQPPNAPVLPHPLHDADAEAVRKKMLEEKGEERESSAMQGEDINVPNAATARDSVAEVGDGTDAVEMTMDTREKGPASSSGRRPGEVVVDSVFDDDVTNTSQLQAMEQQVDLTFGDTSVPVTPPMFGPALPGTPRQPHATRTHETETEGDPETKRAKVETQKKQRINQLREFHESHIRTVKIGNDEFATLDSYEAEVDINDDVQDEDYWADEDQLQFGDVPESLWLDFPLDKVPPPPEQWVDNLADGVEINCLLAMGVLEKDEESSQKASGTLTTRFVYDWRVKQHSSGKKMWMRRSRFVAREFAATKRHDTYSPATGTHTANMIPLIYLKMLQECSKAGVTDNSYDVLLASLDIKDAFLQVPQSDVIEVWLYDQRYLIKRNLPGQRLGAKAWYWHFRNFVSDVLGFTWCVEQPCLAKCVDGGCNNVFMVHVDDLLFCGSKSFWTEKFLPAMSKEFSVSCSVMEKTGDSISFLKRRMVKLDDGIMVVPGTTAEKVVTCFEKAFGVSKVQKIPCDAGIQNEDSTPGLTTKDASAYRSVVGLLLYLARDRPDLMFSVKEVAASMSCPTLCALQRLRKLVGYLKGSGDFGIKLIPPEFGHGRWKQGAECFWVVETFSDADWAANKSHRRSTSCAVHFINNSLAYASSRTQRVVALSSAESELHSMVSGCSDAIFIKRCLQFLVPEDIEHIHWVDNSAARQLVSRQGVGKIRHLSGKILWIQNLVLQSELVVGQIPTEWNCSDIGTKALQKARLLVLLNMMKAMDPESHDMLGQEEFEQAAQKFEGQKNMKNLVKTVMRMAMMMGLESFNLPGADAATTCASHEAPPISDSGTFWLWAFLICMCLLFGVFACVMVKKVNKLAKDLEYCWNQVADENHFAGQQSRRIDTLFDQSRRLEHILDNTKAELQDGINEVSNEASMVHDYASGLHYYIVESGGYLRNGLGLNNDQWIHLTTLERANLVASRTMGAVEYMRLVRQRGAAMGQADQTDPMAEHETSESEMDDDMEVEPVIPITPATPQNLTGMVEFLKYEQLRCIQDGELWDSNAIQNLALECLEKVRDGVTGETIGMFRNKISTLFRDLRKSAEDQHRWQSATRYDRISQDYAG